MRKCIPWLAALLAALASVFLVTMFDSRAFHQLAGAMVAVAVGFIVYLFTCMALRRTR